MRPPIPAFRMSRRAKIGLSVVGSLIVVLIILTNLVGVYINWLWFGQFGLHSVFRTILVTKLVLFLIFGALMALILGANIAIAYWIRPPFRPLSTEQQNLERYRVLLEPRKRVLLIIVMVLSGLAAGLSAAGSWKAWTLWRVGGSFGIKDPQFHRDISFFAWDYPVYRLLLSFGFSAIFFALLLSVAVHYLVGAIRLQTPGPKITMAARRQVTILVFLFIALKAIAYWLDRYGLVYSTRGKVTGASYADVNASLPAKTILFWIAIIIAIAVLASMWLTSARVPAIGFGVLIVLSLLISGIYPALVQHFTVTPNASAKESKYILRNINATQAAYGIQTGTDVTYDDYKVNGVPPASAIVTSDPTVANLRILDPNRIAATFTQQQRIKNVYGFPQKLDVDRYTNSAGVKTDYIVGVRELNAAGLTGEQSNWINLHTVYTHGDGFVAAAANVDVTNNPGLYTEFNLPPVGPLGLTQPDEYFGELLPNYSIVGAKGVTQEYDGSDGPKVSYAGPGGVSLSNPLTRLALAVQYKQTNFILNSSASASGAKIIFDRDPRQMVSKIAPFLTVDSDPYPIVDPSSGHIVWMVDAYTTMSNYPYSQKESLSQLTSDSLSTQGRTAQQPNDQINYIRNSVKATVDAYTGKVTLYDWDSTDPVLKAWSKAFPGLIQPQSAMPQSILQHVRYPEDLFEIQRFMIGTYHVTNPVTFYNVGDKWTVPTDPSDTTANQPPYYVLAAPASGGNDSQFQLTTPMIVNNNQNLAAYISVDSDPGPDYGKMTVLKVPSTTVTNGPEQVENILTTNSVITKDLSLFNTTGGGSQVLHGNLLTLPIGNAFLYVEPLYVQSTASNASYPTLQRVLVVYGDKIGYANNLSDALLNLSNPPVGVSLTTTANPSTSPSPSSGATTSPSSPSSSPPTSGSASSQAQLLKSINTALTTLQDAYKSGNLAAVGAAQQNLLNLTTEYLKQTGVSSSSSSSAPTHSATPTATPSK